MDPQKSHTEAATTLSVHDLIEQIQHTLRFLADSGCRGFDLSDASLEKIKRWGQPRHSPADTLASISSDLGDCRRCRLHANRRTIVFGSGSMDARLVFVGEGPGQEEDLQGLPFVGPAGQLLTKIIGAMGLSRDDVYICNVVKCRPPRNRNPLPDEISTCQPFLDRQLAAIQPEMIVALGTFAAQTLLQTSQPISRLRGKLYKYREIPVTPTFHPAYLLRNPEKKRDVWDDMQKVMRALSLPV
jgi:DNA polymerase